MMMMMMMMRNIMSGYIDMSQKAVPIYFLLIKRETCMVKNVIQFIQVSRVYL